MGASSSIEVSERHRIAEHEIRALLAGCEAWPDEATVTGLFNRTEGAPVSLWGIAPVAPVHFGYDQLLLRQRLLPRHLILFADYHAMMTHGLSYPEVTERVRYYEHYLRECCSISARFLRGSEFQTRPEYVELLLALVNQLEIKQLKPCLPRVIRRQASDGTVRLSAYLYVVMQSLDAAFLGTELLFAEAGQKKIYSLTTEGVSTHEDAIEFSRLNPLERPSPLRLSCPPALYLPTGVDLIGRPLRQSTAATRITIHESRASLEEKVRRMYAPPADQPGRPDRRHALLEYFEHSVFPWRSRPVSIRDEGGRWREFDIHAGFAAAYRAGELHPSECKRALVECLWDRLSVLKERMAAHSGWVDPERV